MAQGQLSISPRAGLLATVGDDWTHKVTLWEDGTVKDVSAATDISAAVQDRGGNQVIAATACSSGASGAAWATGVVVLPFTYSQTGTLIPNEYLLEIQATIGGKKITWPLLSLVTQPGTIS